MTGPLAGEVEFLVGPEIKRKTSLRVKPRKRLRRAAGRSDNFKAARQRGKIGAGNPEKSGG